MEDMNFYNKHYIRIREDGCIVDGFSDAFREPTSTDICINEQGGYQFRLIYFGQDEEKGWPVLKQSEENPSLFDWNGMIPLYRWGDGVAIKRTEEEIEAERSALPVPEEKPSQLDVIEAQLTYTAMMTDTLLEV